MMIFIYKKNRKAHSKSFTVLNIDLKKFYFIARLVF